jgi:hypothetical protein
VEAVTDDLFRRAQAHPGMCVYPIRTVPPIPPPITEESVRAAAVAVDLFAEQLAREATAIARGALMPLIEREIARRNAMVRSENIAAAFGSPALAPDEVELLASIEADRKAARRRWWYRFTRWTRR